MLRPCLFGNAYTYDKSVTLYWPWNFNSVLNVFCVSFADALFKSVIQRAALIRAVK